MPFLSMNHFFLFCLYLNHPNHQMYKMAALVTQVIQMAVKITRNKSSLIYPKTKTLCFFISVQSLLRVSKHICIIRYPEFIHKKINQALKLHFTVVEVLTLVNPNVTNSQCQHTLNYHLINKNMKTIISLIYLKKQFQIFKILQSLYYTSKCPRPIQISE